MCIKEKTTHVLYEVGWNMKLWGQGVKRLESRKSKGMDGNG